MRVRASEKLHQTKTFWLTTEGMYLRALILMISYFRQILATMTFDHEQGYCKSSRTWNRLENNPVLTPVLTAFKKPVRRDMTARKKFAEPAHV